MKQRPSPVDSFHPPIRLRARSRRLSRAGFGSPLKRHLALAAGILALIAPVPLTAQTFTSPSGSATFTNPNAWDFGAGTFGSWAIPASDAALALNFQTFGSGAITGADDLNLTLNTLNLNTNATSALTLSGTLGGDYAFTGATKINLLGSGTAATFSAPIVLGSGAISLTLDGAGASGITISGVISSNSATGVPLNIGTDARNSGTGVVTLGAANTFAGGVVLNTGTLSLGNANALGDIANTLTVNGGVLRAISAITALNSLTLNSALNVNTTSGLTLGGVLSGAGGINLNAGAASQGLILSGTNSYTGPTFITGSGKVQIDGDARLGSSADPNVSFALVA